VLILFGVVEGGAQVTFYEGIVLTGSDAKVRLGFV
jgi:hypothetical protein